MAPKRTESSALFQSVRMLDRTLSGVGSSWSEEEVSDMIRYWILCLGAKAISFPQFINTNNFRLAKGINLKRYYSIPVRCKLLATFKTKKIQAI